MAGNVFNFPELWRLHITPLVLVSKQQPLFQIKLAYLLEEVFTRLMPYSSYLSDKWFARNRVFPVSTRYPKP